MSDGAFFNFENAIRELDSRFTVENDGAKCTVRFPGSAWMPALQMSCDFDKDGLEDLLSQVQANMMYKGRKMPDEVREWFSEMDSAGVRQDRDCTSMTQYFRHKSGEVKEFSYERVLQNPDYRRELLEWANQTY